MFHYLLKVPVPSPLIPLSIIEPITGSAAMPLTLRSMLRTEPPVTSSMRKAKETTASQFLASPVPSHHGDQKPSRNFKNHAPTREITVVFLNSGRRLPLPIPPSLIVGLLSPSSSPRSFSPPSSDFFIAATSPVLFRLGKSFALKPLPLALPPAPIPTIAGNETTAEGFARMSSAFLLVGASGKGPPVAADAVHKLACAA